MLMEYLKYISFFVPPLIAVLIYLYLRFKFSDLSFPLLFKSFIWGMVSIVLVLLVQILASYFDLDKLTNIRRVLFYSLVVVAFFAEFGKYFFLRAFVYTKKEFKTPVDGIIFAVMISMGFATMNNILYFVNLADLSVNTTNALTSGPANVIFGVMMGFFVGLGKLRKSNVIDSMTGLIAAVFFHALYTFCLLTHDNRLLLAFFAGSAIIAISLYIAAVRIQEDARAEEKF